MNTLPFPGNGRSTTPPPQAPQVQLFEFDVFAKAQNMPDHQGPVAQIRAPNAVSAMRLFMAQIANPGAFTYLAVKPGRAGLVVPG